MSLCVTKSAAMSRSSTPGGAVLPKTSGMGPTRISKPEGCPSRRAGQLPRVTDRFDACVQLDVDAEAIKCALQGAVDGMFSRFRKTNTSTDTAADSTGPGQPHGRITASENGSTVRRLRRRFRSAAERLGLRCRGGRRSSAMTAPRLGQRPRCRVAVVRFARGRRRRAGGEIPRPGACAGDNRRIHDVNLS